MNEHLNGKQWLVGSSMTLADVTVASILTPAFQLVLDAGFRKGMKNAGEWFFKCISVPEVIKAAGIIQPCTKALKPAGDAPAGKAPSAKNEHADDDLNLFGDDDNEAADVKAKIEAQKKAKKVKKPVIAQSLVLFEVKPVDDTTDLDQMAAAILKLTGDGIYWKSGYKKEPVAFGIFKLVIGVTVEDEKVSVDDLQEKIEALDTMVQSVEILAFNKI